MTQYWQFIHSKLKQDKIVYLLVVINHKGSSPGKQGFKMIVSDDGEIYGSIGGGIMEYNLVEFTKELLEKKEYRPFAKLQIHKGNVIDGSGMICSGEQTIIFYPLQKNNLNTIDNIIKTYLTNKSGTLHISPIKFSFSSDERIDTQYLYTYSDKLNWSYTECLNKRYVACIIGGGHVGLAVTKLLKDLGFYVLLYDNRANLNTFEQNEFADEKYIIDYNEIGNKIKEKSGAYCAIMTNKYTDDKLVLSKLLGEPFKFLGILGSRAKLNVLFEVLRKEGYNEENLKKVYAPIGLSIRSQTPEEIAVSITAQIINIKNKKK